MTLPRPLNPTTGVSCGPPRPLEHGSFQGTDFLAGGSVAYQCSAGFYLLGDARSQCTNSGKWASNLPACLGNTLPSALDWVMGWSLMWWSIHVVVHSCGAPFMC